MCMMFDKSRYNLWTPEKKTYLKFKLQVVGITGLILTKLDGSARGGCVVYSNLHYIFLSFLSNNSSIQYINKIPMHVGERGWWTWHSYKICGCWRKGRRSSTFRCRELCQRHFPLIFGQVHASIITIIFALPPSFSLYSSLDFYNFQIPFF